MARTVAVLALFIVFAAGVAAGVAGTRVLAGRATADAAAPAEPRVLGPDARILDGLELSARQRAAIDTVLTRHRADALRAWRDVAPRFREIVAAARAEIRGVLTPEQQREFDRRLNLRRQALQRRMGGPIGEDVLAR